MRLLKNITLSEREAETIVWSLHKLSREIASIEDRLRLKGVYFSVRKKIDNVRKYKQQRTKNEH